MNISVVALKSGSRERVIGRSGIERMGRWEWERKRVAVLRKG